MVASSQRRAVGIWLVVSVAALSCSERADAQTPTPHGAALAEFREARKLVDAGDCAGALPHLERSLAHESSIGARLSVAECVEATEPLRAWKSLADAAALAYVTHDDRLQLAEERVAQVERALPTLRVVLTPSDLARPGLEVSLDGAPVDRYHLRRGIVAVSNGEHTVEVRAPGMAPWSRKVIASAPGSTAELAVELTVRPPEIVPLQATPARVVVHSDSRVPRRAAGLALLATGVVGVGVGVTFGILALGKASDLDEACGGTRQACTTSPRDVSSTQQSAVTMANVSTVSLIAGAVAAAAGVGLLLWPSPSSPAKTAGGTRLTPTTGRSHGLALEGTF